MPVSPSFVPLCVGLNNSRKKPLNEVGMFVWGQPIIERLNVVFSLSKDGKAVLLNPANSFEPQFSEKKTQFHQNDLTVEYTETVAA